MLTQPYHLSIAMLPSYPEACLENANAERKEQGLRQAPYSYIPNIVHSQVPSNILTGCREKILSMSTLFLMLT